MAKMSLEEANLGDRSLSEHQNEKYRSNTDQTVTRPSSMTLRLFCATGGRCNPVVAPSAVLTFQDTHPIVSRL